MTTVLFIVLFIILAYVVILFAFAHSGDGSKTPPQKVSKAANPSTATKKAHSTSTRQTEWYLDPDKSLSGIGEELGNWLAGRSNPRLEKAFRERKLDGNLQQPMTPAQEQKLAKIRVILEKEPPEYDLDTVAASLDDRYTHFKTPSYGDDYPDPYGDAVFKAISAVYTKTRALEKQKDTRRALDYYILILLTVVPLGNDYYLRPAILLERFKYYDAALAVCNLRQVHLLKDAGAFPNDLQAEWQKRKTRLQSKLNASSK